MKQWRIAVFGIVSRQEEDRPEMMASQPLAHPAAAYIPKLLRYFDAPKEPMMESFHVHFLGCASKALVQGSSLGIYAKDTINAAPP